jgi:hypothetical protein
MPPAGFYVTRTSARRLEARGPRWDVLVRVDLMEKVDGGFTPVEPRHFIVGIETDAGDGLRAVSLPTPSPAPTPPGPPTAMDARVPADQATTLSVTNYLDWYLTESATINGQAPAGGFDRIDLLSLELNPEAATGLAVVLATTAFGHRIHLEIPLDVEYGSGGLTVGISRESS